MTYVVTSACVDCVHTDCVAVCPVDCFYEAPNGRMLYINTEECIDCSCCQDACPMEAIYYENEVPDGEDLYLSLAKEATENNEGELVTEKRNPLSTDGTCAPNWKWW